jgi:hypothetical protein
MTKAPDQGWRRARLAALAEHEEFRGRAPLGRALGYKDGAYVRQMIEGERTISEKTIAAIETMRGGKFKGWFDMQAHGEIRFSVIDSAPPAPPPDFSDRRVAPTDSDWALLEDLRWLPAEEIESLRAKARAQREITLAQIERLKAEGKLPK